MKIRGLVMLLAREGISPQCQYVIKFCTSYHYRKEKNVQNMAKLWQSLIKVRVLVGPEGARSPS